MVYKVGQKVKVFLDSFILALLIFLIAFSIGFYVEYYRTDKIIDSYSQNEIDSLDLRLQNYYYQIMDSETCDSAIEQNFIFADELYDTGLEISKFENSNELTDDLIFEKQKYVLLKTELWLNSVLLKSKCGDSFDTVVYLYSQYPLGDSEVFQNEVISNILKSVKEKKGERIVLLPIAGDIGLGIVDLQVRIYNITDLPAIIINEKTILYGLHNESEIEAYLR